MDHTQKILVYGYGNPGRQDDGLGVMLADEIEKWAKELNLERVHTDSNYQLNLEDAAGIAAYDLVIFADASKEEIPGFHFAPLNASPRVEFTMHAVSPSFVLHICRQVFHCSPDAYLIQIKGYKWEFMDEPTEGARDNLDKALAYLKTFIDNYQKKIS